MNQSNLGADGGQRRGGGLRWVVILLFSAYGAWSWFGNQKPDPYPR